MAVASNAEVVRPPHSFAEDFRQAAAQGYQLPEGWTSYGVGKAVNAKFQSYFGDQGAAPYYRVWDIDGTSAAWSCSTFEYADQADEWLVTPPIHITSDAEVLEFTAVANGAYASNRYRVLISESGQDKESFRPNPLVNTTLTGWETEVRSKSSYIALNGYLGKDICLAFVNKSNDSGMLGFTDITIAPYTMEVNDLTPSVLPAGTETSISLSANIRTPMDVEGIKAELTTSAGDTRELQIPGAISISGTRINISFEDITVPAGGLEYTVTITPNMDNASAVVVNGEIGTPSTSYPAAALVEEFTGTWCGNCPRGIAFMEYYKDYYTGQNGRIKTIGIAIHSDNDPMLMKDHSYLNTAFDMAGVGGYPSAFFNRTIGGDPSDAYILDQTPMLSNSRIGIKRVNYTAGEPIKVEYTVENSYSKKNMNQRVALVMIENEVKGTTRAYNQINGLAGVSEGAVKATYGAELWPYFKRFAQGPETISYQDIAYDHVARGIWPDYYGTLLTDGCQAEIPNDYEMTFEMPSQVMVPEHTAIIALLLDASTGALINATEVEAEDYNKDLSSVTLPESRDVDMRLDGKTLKINMPSQGMIDVYSADGRALIHRQAKAGYSEFELDSIKGMAIIHITDKDGRHYSAKYIL